jgi:glycosyltransferase involved in cell wall biosynthesis
MAANARAIQTVALIGSYVPRKCGIATFTKDLRDAIAAEVTRPETFVLSMDDTPEGYDYPPEVRVQIQAHRIQDYRLAADLLNINQIDVAIIEHEFGIFGGKAGNFILEFARGLRMPVMTTFHTVLPEPNLDQDAAARELVAISDRVIVMSELARNLVQTAYGAPPEKVVVIPHGIPDVPFVDPSFYKDQFGLEGQKVLLTFGLLSPGKAIEVAIRALPAIVAKHPNLTYVVLGATHPHILKREGNAYVNGLERLAARLGVGSNVIFLNRYVPLEELCRYIGAADIYLTPYQDKSQICSGTLAYAMGMGKAVVSTPYLYAEEMLAEDRGRLFPFGDADALARNVLELLGDRTALDAIRKRAYMAGRRMVWKEVAHSYLENALQVVSGRATTPRPIQQFLARKLPLVGIPEVSMTHMRTLTDDTGILQHAVYAIPDRFHGYCTDDNARALITALRYHEISKDDSVLSLTSTYLAFLHHAYNPKTEGFRNFLTYDRRWTEETGSEDSHGRAVWSLGQTVALAPNDSILSFATRLFATGAATLDRLRSPRALAFAVIGLHAYLERFSGDAKARRLRSLLAERLYDDFRRNASDEWPWCEETMTYANASLPHALLLAGQWLPHDDMVQQGLRSLEWLLRLQVTEDGKVSLIGNHGWLAKSGARARFDQQPIDAAALVDACAEAYRCTGDEAWRNRAVQCLGWFLGNNDTESVLHDASTEGCRDGLHADGPNLNEGAESTLAWLDALLTVHWLIGAPHVAR